MKTLKKAIELYPQLRTTYKQTLLRALLQEQADFSELPSHSALSDKTLTRINQMDGYVRTGNEMVNHLEICSRTEKQNDFPLSGLSDITLDEIEDYIEQFEELSVRADNENDFEAARNFVFNLKDIESFIEIVFYDLELAEK